MRKALTLTVFFVASVVNGSSHQAKHTALMSKIEDLNVGPTDPMYYVQGLRGLYNGVEDGLHKSKSSTDICFNDETQENLIHIIETAIKMNFNDMKDLIPDVMEIVQNVKQCVTSKDTLYSFCLEDMSRCTPMQLQQNIQKNIFVIMSKFADMQTLIKVFPADNSNELYDQTYQAGTDIGAMVKVAFNYKDHEKTPVTKRHF